MVKFDSISTVLITDELLVAMITTRKALY